LIIKFQNYDASSLKYCREFYYEKFFQGLNMEQNRKMIGSENINTKKKNG